MSSDLRFLATVAREARWAIDDHVPHQYKTDGCDHCYMGWVNGPGLLYRCHCNLTEGEDYYYEEGYPNKTTEATEEKPSRLMRFVEWFTTWSMK